MSSFPPQPPARFRLMTAVVARPSFDVKEDLRMGSCNDIEFLRSGASESILCKLLQSTGRIFVRCEDTVAQTPRVLRSWCLAGRRHFSYILSRPCRVNAESGGSAHIWQRFLCCIVRISCLAWNLREKTHNICHPSLKVTIMNQCLG